MRFSFGILKLVCSNTLLLSSVVEQQPDKLLVAGSNPAPATKIKSSPVGECFILSNILRNIFADFPAN